MNNISKIEFKTQEEIKVFQESELKIELQYLLNNSKFYQRLFRENNIDIKKIKSIEDLEKIPVTTKQDIQLYNDDFLCVDRCDIVDYVTSSGTLGHPVTFALTDGDLNRLAYNEAHSFALTGVQAGDTIQLMTTIDRRFMAGLAYFLGARELKCGVVRVGNGIPELQWDTIDRIKPNTCIVVPSFLIKLAKYAQTNNIDYTASSLRRAICIGEALKDDKNRDTSLAQQIKVLWPDLELFSTYASSEMQSSFTECSCHTGSHQPVDLIIVELLDENNMSVDDGTIGEVTITTLGVKGMPLLRFKTGDMCYKYSSQCDCGRNSLRLSSVLGRKGHMIKLKGTTLYPPAIYNVLDNIDEVENYIVEVSTNSIGTDHILVRIGSPNSSEELKKQIKDLFRAKIRIAPDVIFESVESILKVQMPTMSRKVIKFFDFRDN